jgi:hypothetical protein
VDTLVAPVALYPDPLLGQVLAASTYPLEIIEAQQWLDQHSNLRGAQLVDAAKQLNWDPSIQALVVLPDALSLLSNDIQWTTDLGNAFLAQQADVMSAVQRMRARAKANGRLATTPQQVVTTDTQNGESAIEIQPADPQDIYVPVYEPDYAYGPPAWGSYPDLWYPPDFGIGFGFGFGPGIYMGGFFPGWGGWGGWGWGCGWFGNGLFVNAGFFNQYGFRGGFGGGFGGRFGGGGLGGRTGWAHDPGHRGGVPYPNQGVANRFNSTRFNSSASNGSLRSNGPASIRSDGSASNGHRAGGGQLGAGNRAGGGVNASGSGWRTFNGDNRAPANGGYATSARQASPNGGYATQGSRTPAQSYRGDSGTAQSYRGGTSTGRAYATQPSPRGQSYSAPRSYAAPRQSYSAPRSSSGGGGSSGAGSFSGGGGGGHSGFSGGGGGGHAGGGGGGRR